MGERERRVFLVPVLLAGLFQPLPLGAVEPGFAEIEITAKPIEQFATGNPEMRFGALEFRGGLVLTSTAPEFGSLSGIDFAPDGETIYAIGDNGYWFKARIIETDGRLTGIDSARMAPILDSKGSPVIGKRLGDAESLRLTERDGHLTALISFEQVNNIRQFGASPDLANSPSKVLKLPAFVGGLRRNQGLETVAVAPAKGPLAGATVLVSERSIDSAGDILAFVLTGPKAGQFAIRRTDDFDITDGAFLPDGDLIILERKFGITAGLSMRVRRIRADDIRRGRTVDGETLMEADMRSQIDNMEGIAIKRGKNGETIIAVVSDDNHSLLQRTIILEFALVPGAIAPRAAITAAARSGT